MKKLIIVSVLTIFLLSGCGCHNFGLKTGMNIASISSDETDNFDFKTGVFFGGFAELCINDNFAIQPELLYSMQGAKYKESDGYSGEFKLDYLNIPIMGKIKITEEFIAEIGPQFGFLVSAKDEFKSSGDSGEEDIKDFVSGFDYGANLGISYVFDSGFNLGARYNLGLSDLNDSESSDKLRNNVFQFSVGYKF